MVQRGFDGNSNNQWMNFEYNLGNHFRLGSFIVPVTGTYSFYVSVQPQSTELNQVIRLEREGDSKAMAVAARPNIPYARPSLSPTNFMQSVVYGGMAFVVADSMAVAISLILRNNQNSIPTDCLTLQATVKLKKNDIVKVQLSDGFTELNDPSRTYFEGRLIEQTSS